jgi:hypothetical protein
VQNLPRGLALMCASAGNFGQAMAYACRARGVTLTVYAAEQANPLKIARMRAMGARVVLAGEDFDAAKLLAREAAMREGARFVEDSRDPEPTEGAGVARLPRATRRPPRPARQRRDAGRDRHRVQSAASANSGRGRWREWCASHDRVVAIRSHDQP